MKKHCATALKMATDHLDRRFKPSEFFKLFEEQLGWRPQPSDYGCTSKELLIGKLYEHGALLIDVDARHQLYVYLPSRKPKPINFENAAAVVAAVAEDKKRLLAADSDVQVVTTVSARSAAARLATLTRDLKPDEREKKKEIIKRYTEQFIQNHIRYETMISSEGIMRQIALKSRHTIIISNVKHPKEIQIQLADNEPLLNNLMDEMEKTYYGIGSTTFDMPVEYVKFAKLCAALYPQDSNWHRCQIIGVNKDANWAKVMFIDYGGDSNVPLRELKFLHHRFAELPVQAVTAHLFNVKEPTTPPKTTTASSNIIKRPSNGHHSRTSWWPSDMINYLLNRVTNKQFEAEVRGMSGDSLALDIYERDVDPENPNEDKWIWLNEQIVMDGYGEWFDETKDFSFNEFDIWSKKILAKAEPTNSNGAQYRASFATMPSKSFFSMTTRPHHSRQSPLARDTLTGSSRQPRNQSISPSSFERRIPLIKTAQSTEEPRPTTNHKTWKKHSIGNQNKSEDECDVKTEDDAIRVIDDDDDDDDADDEIEDDEEALKAGKYELKERKLLIKIPRRKEKYLNILAINKRAYIHASQLVQITGVYELVVDEMIKRLAATSPIKNEFYLRLDSKCEYNQEIMEWVSSRLAIDTSLINHIDMLRFDKMNMFLDNLLRPEIAARYKEFVDKAKSVPPYPDASKAVALTST